MLEAPPSLDPERTPREGETFSGDASRRSRILLRDGARSSDRGGGAGMAGRGEPERCDRVGNRAGRGHAMSSVPSANSAGACRHAHHGRGPLPTWQSQAPRAPGSAAGALWHAWLGCRQRAREGGPGTGGRGTLREAGLRGGPWPTPLPPAPPAHRERRTGRQGLAVRPPRALPARRPAPTCRVRGGRRPLPGHYPLSSFGNLPSSYPRVSGSWPGDSERGCQARCG